MNAHYNYLFRLKLLHEYFRDLQAVHLDVEPAADCHKLFHGAHILWQKGKGTYTALIRENELHEPFTNTMLADGTGSVKSYRASYRNQVFRLYIRQTNPVFTNYTNLELGDIRRKILYASNLADNRQNNFLFLSRRIGLHATATAYKPGQLVMAPGTNHVLECIRKHTSTTTSLNDPQNWVQKGLRFLRTPLKVHTSNKLYQPGDLVLQPATAPAQPENVFEARSRHVSAGAAELANTSLWQPRGQGQLQYPVPDDFIGFSSGESTIVLPAPVAQATVQIFGLDLNAAPPAFTLPVRSQELVFQAPATTITLSLAGLKPGRYRIQVNATETSVYYDPALRQPGILGVIEIFNHLPGGDPYAFLDAQEKFRKPDYVLCFPARRVLWKYIRKDNKPQSITDSGSTAFAFTLQQDAFVSNQPIPLAEEALGTLELGFQGTNIKMKPLPNPGAEHLCKWNQQGYDYLCSELYLNY